MRCDSTNVGTCCHFCYDPVCTDRLEKRMDPSSGIGGKDGIRLFAVVAIAGNLLGMILTLQNGWTGVSSGIPSGKGGYRII